MHLFVLSAIQLCYLQLQVVLLLDIVVKLHLLARKLKAAPNIISLDIPQLRQQGVTRLKGEKRTALLTNSSHGRSIEQGRKYVQCYLNAGHAKLIAVSCNLLKDQSSICSTRSRTANKSWTDFCLSQTSAGEEQS